MKKKKNKLGKVIGIIVYILICFIFGIIIGYLLVKNDISRMYPGNNVYVWILCQLVIIYLCIFLHIIIHEAGHMIFGLLTGYRFLSFRIMNFIWIKDNGKIKLKKYHLAGTSGQCLMSPPDMKDGKMPFVLYNLGGSIANFVSAIIFAGLFVFCRNILIVSALLICMSVIGIVLGLSNAIPLKFGMVNNDGYNTIVLMKSKRALSALWIQLKIAEETARGVRIKDMPEEWFYLPDDSDMDNSFIAAEAVYYENYLMDKHEFDKVKDLADKLLNMESGMIGVYRNLLICDRIYCELISGRNRNIIDSLYSTALIKFLKQMKKFPSVIRTNYSIALLYNNDNSEAKQIKEQFRKSANTYPYISDIESEQELMMIAEET